MLEDLHLYSDEYRMICLYIKRNACMGFMKECIGNLYILVKNAFYILLTCASHPCKM